MLVEIKDNSIIEMGAYPIESVTLHDISGGEWILDRYDDNSLIVIYKGKEISPEDPSVIEFEDISFEFYYALREQIKSSTGWELTVLMGEAARTYSEEK